MAAIGENARRLSSNTGTLCDDGEQKRLGLQRLVICADLQIIEANILIRK